jgi:hypothetical protein
MVPSLSPECKRMTKGPTILICSDNKSYCCAMHRAFPRSVPSKPLPEYPRLHDGSLPLDSFGPVVTGYFEDFFMAVVVNLKVCLCRANRRTLTIRSPLLPTQIPVRPLIRYQMVHKTVPLRKPRPVHRWIPAPVALVLARQRSQIASSLCRTRLLQKYKALLVGRLDRIRQR